MQIHKMKSEAAPRRHRRPRQYVWAAATVLAICLAVVLQPSFNIWLTADYTTSTAQIRNIRLEDGSIVHLGADSAIEIAFEPEMRRIQLLSGEAYFEVEPNPMRPFKVEARNVETTVLGTAFDVRLMSDGVTVAVNRGRVGVVGSRRRPVLDAPLEAGDWVHVDRNGLVERGNDEPELVASWRTGMLVVKNRPISEVVDEIRRHYRGKIILAENELGGQRITGVYDLRKPVDALRAAVQVHGANVRQISPWMAVVSSY
ncbi:FecR family protein [Brucella cytisi]|uniref:FecR family protein n=1 Tax=Brucella cytisi TaxID=407152 RepID=UPI0035D80692